MWCSSRWHRPFPVARNAYSSFWCDGWGFLHRASSDTDVCSLAIQVGVLSSDKSTFSCLERASEWCSPAECTHWTICLLTDASCSTSLFLINLSRLLCYRRLLLDATFLTNPSYLCHKFISHQLKTHGDCGHTYVKSTCRCVNQKMKALTWTLRSCDPAKSSFFAHTIFGYACTSWSQNIDLGNQDNIIYPVGTTSCKTVCHRRSQLGLEWVRYIRTGSGTSVSGLGQVFRYKLLARAR